MRKGKSVRVIKKITYLGIFDQMDTVNIQSGRRRMRPTWRRYLVDVKNEIGANKYEELEGKSMKDRSAWLYQQCFTFRQ